MITLGKAQRMVSGQVGSKGLAPTMSLKIGDWKVNKPRMYFMYEEHNVSVSGMESTKDQMEK